MSGVQDAGSESSTSTSRTALRAPLSPRIALWTGTLLSKHSHSQEGEARQLTLGHGDLRAVACNLWLKLYAEAQQFPLSDDVTLSPDELDGEKVRYHEQIETRERMKETSAAVEGAREGVAAVLGEQATDEIVEMLHRREDAIDNLAARSIALDKPYRAYGCAYAEDYWKQAGMEYDPIDDEEVDEGMIALEECTREEVEALELAVRFRAAEGDLALEHASTSVSCGEVVQAERLLRHYRELVAGASTPDPTELQHIDASRAALAPIAASCIAAAANGDGHYPPLVLVSSSNDDSASSTAPLKWSAVASLRDQLQLCVSAAEAPAGAPSSSSPCAEGLQALKDAYRVPENPELTPSQVEVAKSDLLARLQERLDARALAEAVEHDFAALDEATGGLAGPVLGALRGHDAILQELAVRIAALNPAVEELACRFFAFEPPELETAGGPPRLAVNMRAVEARSLLSSLDLRMQLARAAARGADGAGTTDDEDIDVPVPCGLVERLSSFLQASTSELSEAQEQCPQSDPEAADGIGEGDWDEDDPAIEGEGYGEGPDALPPADVDAVA